MSVLLTAEVLAERVKALGAQIANDYRDEPLTLVPVLTGSFVFAADLVRAIDLPLEVSFVGVSSYGDATESSGHAHLTLDLARSVEGRHVLVVEDIVDTGTTADAVLHLLAGRGALSVKLCTLLHKPSRSVVAVPLAYVGFEVPDVFVVGYGLDGSGGFCRNRPAIHAET
jgi:hypoxanthine phosphoribosyltransferase